VLALAHLHRHVGMGGDMYVAAVAGEEVERQIGDDVRDEWEHQFDGLLDEIAPFAGAHDLIAELKERGHKIVLASSSIAKHAEHFVDLLEVRELVDGWTTKDDVEASKPEPDLVQAAMQKVQHDRAVMLGDTPWDVEAARRAGVETVCLMTGGFSEQELRDAGAAAVFESLPDLRAHLEATPFGAH
jgi:HAD superfamily hydrolase (TIGR01549 family)